MHIHTPPHALRTQVQHIIDTETDPELLACALELLDLLQPLPAPQPTRRRPAARPLARVLLQKQPTKRRLRKPSHGKQAPQGEVPGRDTRTVDMFAPPPAPRRRRGPAA